MKEKIEELREIIEELEEIDLTEGLARFYRDKAIKSLRIAIEEIEASAEEKEEDETTN